MILTFIVKSVNESTNKTTEGTTKKQVVKLRAEPQEAAEGVKMLSAAEITLTITDETKFDTYIPGDAVVMNSAAN